jgi:hypothetical protein
VVRLKHPVTGQEATAVEGPTIAPLMLVAVRCGATGGAARTARRFRAGALLRTRHHPTCDVDDVHGIGEARAVRVDLKRARGCEMIGGPCAYCAGSSPKCPSPHFLPFQSAPAETALILNRATTNGVIPALWARRAIHGGDSRTWKTGSTASDAPLELRQSARSLPP